MDEPHSVWSWQERELFAMAEAYSHLHRGNSAGAIEILQGLITFAERQGLFRSCLRAYLLLVAALDAAGDPAAADRTFEAALRLGQQSGMARAFMEIGAEPVRRRVAARVIAFRKDRNIDLKQAKLLRSLSHWEGVTKSTTLTRLTPREGEVLAAVEKGEADKRIGRRLGVTEHAVRYHLKNIYRKLGVHDRLGAVARAREAGLLTSS
jgi:LuxR family maltose regulon positive regulatory protein